MQRLVRRYGAWQLRDYVLERGVWTVALGLALLAVFWLNYDSTPPRQFTDPTLVTPMPPGEQFARIEAESQARQLAAWVSAEPARFRSGVELLFVALGFAGTLIATHGIVSRDRERGFYRFLFAKPIDAAAFYGQAFVINGLGLIATSAALLGVTALAFGRAVPITPLAVVGAEYALLGGTVFLLSTLWRFDFVLAALSWPAAALVAALAHDRRSGPLWASIVEPLLPPMYRFGEFAEAVVGPGRVEPSHLVIVVGYGACCFALGLHVLGRRARAGA
jgi:ABC-type transport system involved in multi-copper enzyme maturation permease subunit